MSATQNPGKILKMWQRATEKFGMAPQKADAKKDPKKGPGEKEKAVESQQAHVAKGLTKLRDVAKTGVQTPEKVNAFNSTRNVVVKTMKKFCLTIKSFKPEGTKDIAKLRLSSKQLTVVVENLKVNLLETDDDGEADLSVLDAIDTKALDKEMEDPNFGKYSDSELAVADGEGWTAATPTGDKPPSGLPVGTNRAQPTAPTPVPSQPAPAWQTASPSKADQPGGPPISAQRTPPAPWQPGVKPADASADKAPPIISSERDPGRLAYQAQFNKLKPALDILAKTPTIDVVVNAGLKKAEDLVGQGEFAKATAALGDTLKSADAESKAKKIYDTRLGVVQPSFNNAKRTPTCEPIVTGGLSTAASQAQNGNYTEAVATLNATLQTVSQHLRVQSDAIGGEAIKLRDQALDQRITLKTDPVKQHDTIAAKCKSWDLVGAQADLDSFKKEIAQAPKLGRDLGNMGDVRAGHAGAQFDTRRVGGSRFAKNSLQNASFARNTEQSRSAAVRLVSADGGIDLGAEGMLNVLGVDTKGKTKDEIDYLVNQMPFFFGSDDVASLQSEVDRSDIKDLPQSKHALKMLKRLETDEDLRKKVDAIDAPDEASNPAACTMIRATLGMPVGAPISKAHAQQAAVAALLTQLRQTDVGSCFATAMAIQAQQKQPGVLLDDFKTMFATGKVTRTSKGKTIEVPLSPDMSTSDLDKTIKVPRTGSNLHATPAFQAVLDALGVPPGERETVMNAAVTALRPTPTGGRPTPVADELTAQKIIAKIVDNRKAGKTPEQVKQEMDAGRASFQGQQDNRLLRAWEYSVAATAELDEFKSSRLIEAASKDAQTNMIAAINGAFSALSPIQQAAQRPSYQSFVNDFKGEFAEEFKKSVRMVYDASIATEPAADGSSSRGVWVMQDIETGEKIVDKAGQDKLIKKALGKLQVKHQNTPDKKAKIDGVVGVVRGLAISAADPQQLDGHATSSLVRVFNNNPTDLATDSVATPPASGDALLKWMAGATKKVLTGPTKSTVEGNPSAATVPIWNTVHGFSLKVGNPLFLEIANQPATGGKTADQIVEQHIDAEKKKCKGIQDTPLTDAVKAQIYDKMLDGWADKQTFIRAFNASLAPTATVKDLVAVIDNATFLTPEGKMAFKDMAAGAVLQTVTPPEPAAEPLPLTTAVTDEMIMAMYSKTFGETRQGQRYTAIREELAKTPNPTIADLTKAIRTIIIGMYADGPGEDRSAVRAGLTNNLAASRPNKPLPVMEQKVDALLKQLGVPTDKHAAAKQKALQELSKSKEANMAQLEIAVNAALKAAGHQLDPDEGKQKAAINKALVPPVAPKGVVFGDSNWGDGDHTTLLSMVVNPLTSEMQMWQMNEDGSDPLPKDPAKWISGAWGMPTDPAQFGGVV
jgi:hypothetical protein